MIKIISKVILLTSGNLLLAAQLRLKIMVENIDNTARSVIMDFKDSNNKYLKGFSQDISNACKIVVDSLKAVKYSFRYFYRENDNKKLDANWIGVFKEGCGFSYKARGTLGTPKFLKTAFEITGENIL